VLRDIEPGPHDSIPRFQTRVGGRVLFAANDGTHGVELWRSDGTAAGTRLVRDINPGAHSFPSYLAAAGNRVFFAANDGPSGFDLWKSDGLP
jgi:ELWxxDGT repeat protein